MAEVSIHAPTRGATRFFPPLINTSLVSIHAPTRGATNVSITEDKIQTFQSTHPRGVRLIQDVPVTELVGVSIHAPTRGATGEPAMYGK